MVLKEKREKESQPIRGYKNHCRSNEAIEKTSWFGLRMSPYISFSAGLGLGLAALSYLAIRGLNHLEIYGFKLDRKKPRKEELEFLHFDRFGRRIYTLDPDSIGPTSTLAEASYNQGVANGIKIEREQMIKRQPLPQPSKGNVRLADQELTVGPKNGFTETLSNVIETSTGGIIELPIIPHQGYSGRRNAYTGRDFYSHPNHHYNNGYRNGYNNRGGQRNNWRWRGNNNNRNNNNDNRRQRNDRCIDVVEAPNITKASPIDALTSKFPLEATVTFKKQENQDSPAASISGKSARSKKKEDQETHVENVTTQIIRLAPVISGKEEPPDSEDSSEEEDY